MPKEYRIFDGRKFYFRYLAPTKLDARKLRTILKAEGANVRVTKAARGYHVWATKRWSEKRNKRKRVSRRVSRNPVKHMILGDLALHGLSLLH